MTYAMLYQILTEAEQRARNESLPNDVRARSQETVDLCNLRLSREGLTKAALRRAARQEA